MQAVIKEENLSAFSDKANIARKNLDDGMKAGGLTAENQTKLAQVCDFRLDWPERNNPKAVRQTAHEERSDTAEKFVQLYRKENGMCLKTDTEIQRQAGLRLVPRQHQLDIWSLITLDMYHSSHVAYNLVHKRF